MKKVLCAIVAMVMIVSMFGGVLLAEVRTDYAIVYRGGSSKVFPAALKESADGSAWCSNLTYVHAFGGGFPAGLIGSNGFYSRMRTNESESNASPTLLHTYQNYTGPGNNRLWQNFYSSYGGNGEYYRMATSMASFSAHSSASVTYRWNP